jgi:peptidoglycan/xylan/chitin deacetylase (PgdA/CDA1 family)
MITGKKAALAKICDLTGMTRMLEYARARPSLLVMNYHRIGDAASELFDRSVYTCTASALDEQIDLVKRKFAIINSKELERIVQGGAFRRTHAMITFDDGFIDNFEVAAPILRQHSVPAVFFLISGMTGTNHIAWWDEIAFLVRNCPSAALRLKMPFPCIIDLRANRELAIRKVLRLYKHPKNDSPDAFMRALRDECTVTVPKVTAPRFFDWTAARAMIAMGFEFGSHTHSHRLLSTLPYDLQLEELQRSKEVIEQHTREKVSLIAYPVGSRSAFNADTRKAVKASGYKFGFSFYGGINRGSADPTDLLRFEPAQPGLFRFQLAVNAVTARQII